MMKKVLLLILSLIIVLSLASCDFFNIGGTLPLPSDSTTSAKPSTTRPTMTTPPTSTSTTKKEEPEDDHIYNAFTSSEKSIMRELIGEVIPFIPNDEYYVEQYALDRDDGTTEIGINFYTFGNTQAEFNSYRALFSSYTYDGNDTDDYGDAWYFYTAKDESYYVDMTFYYYEGYYVVEVYAYYLKESTGNEGSTTHTYTSFTATEKALMNNIIGAVIPFIPNDDYTLEEYTYDYGDGESEYGVHFYTFDNTQAEFEAYRALFSSYDYQGSETDSEGDTWYYYDAPDDSYFVDLVYYNYDGSYVVEVYAYYIDATGSSGGSGDSGDSDSTDTDSNLITNEGAGLPAGVDGVFEVDFTKAEYVKDVTDQGYYIDGCPTTGSPAVLVIPVQFSDSLAADKGYTTEALLEAFKKDGEVDYYSVYDYYYISSYGDLTLDITVLDEWFMPKYDSTYYYNATYDYYGNDVAIGDQLVLDEALAYLAGTMDLSKFDSDNNGIIDSVVLVNTLDVDEETFYWAYRYWNIYTDDEGYYYEYDGVSANDYIWASYQFLRESYDDEGYASYTDTSVMNTYTFIHEFGHILGLDDYYDTAYVGAPLDGCDIMDTMTGDHNAFSKFNLGWITSSTLVVTDSSVTLTLEDFSKNGDTIILANNWDEKLGAYQEYYILVYYKNNGLNEGDEYGYFARDGVVMYHVNASLIREDYDGEYYYDIYNNNTDASSSDGYGTAENLIELVKSGDDTFTYIVGTACAIVVDDNGQELGYSFTVDALTDEYATITFNAK